MIIAFCGACQTIAFYLWKKQKPLEFAGRSRVAMSCQERKCLPVEVGVQRPLLKMFINKQWQTQVLWPHSASDLWSNRKRSRALDYKCIRTAGTQNCIANTCTHGHAGDAFEPINAHRAQLFFFLRFVDIDIKMTDKRHPIFCFLHSITAALSYLFNQHSLPSGVACRRAASSVCVNCWKSFSKGNLINWGLDLVWMFP